MSTKSSRGFSIVELLVVMSIVALLIAILLPSLSRARERARYLRWQAYSHGLRSDPNVVMYFNFEQQDGTETQSDGTPILWNRAGGDALAQSRDDIEPEDYNGQLGYWDKGNPAKRPTWTFDKNRWKGKGGLEFGPIINREHVFVPHFRAFEGGQTNFKAFNDFSLLWSTNMFSGASWNQELSVNHRHLQETINGGNSNPWGRFVFHSTTNQSVYAGTGPCCGARIQPSDPGIGAQYTPLNEWHSLAYTRHPDQGPTDASAAMYLNGELSHRERHNESNGDWNGFSIGRNNTNTLHGLLDELLFVRQEWDASRVATFARVGAARIRE